MRILHLNVDARSALSSLFVFCCAASPVAADTVYYGSGTDSVVFAKDVVVREHLSRADRVVFWEHRDVEQPVGLSSRTCESNCRVVSSSPGERGALIEDWKQGIGASISDRAGHISPVHDLVIRFGAPPGYLCIGCLPKAAYQSFWVRIGGPAGPPREFKFDGIRTIEFLTASDLKIVLTTGESVSGSLVVGTAKLSGAAEASAAEMPLQAVFSGWQHRDSTDQSDFGISEFTISAGDIQKIELSSVPATFYWTDLAGVPSPLPVLSFARQRISAAAAQVTDCHDRGGCLSQGTGTFAEILAKVMLAAEDNFSAITGRRDSERKLGLQAEYYTTIVLPESVACRVTIGTERWKDGKSPQLYYVCLFSSGTLSAMKASYQGLVNKVMTASQRPGLPLMTRREEYYAIFSKTSPVTPGQMGTHIVVQLQGSAGRGEDWSVYLHVR